MRRVLVFLLLALTASSAAAAPKRALPNYDGRGNVDAHAKRGALWIPKILLWPIATVHEYVIRKPLGGLFRSAEHHRWAARVRDFVTFGPGKRSFLVPTAVYEFGFKPSVGLYLQLSDLGTPRHDLRIHGATWGSSWLSGVIYDRYTTQHGTSLAVRGSFVRRPDFLFLGIGPDVTKATRSRYGRQKLDVRGIVGQQLGLESSVTLAAGVMKTSFREGNYGTDPSLDERIADGTLPTPPGYEAYATTFERLELQLDTRQPRPASGTGGYLAVHEEVNVGFHGTDDQWIDYGGVGGGAFDLDGHQRTVTAQLGVDFVDPFTGIVPFDQLALLDQNLMPGFLPGWATGRSAIAGQLAYTWPVSIWADGALRFSVGNVFDQHLSGLSAGALRLSTEVGLTAIGARTSGFELSVGVGTKTFDQGSGIDCVSILLRSRRGL